MTRIFLHLLLPFIFVLLSSPPAAAAGEKTKHPAEIRCGILSHDVSLWHSGREDGIDLNLEVRFPHPDFPIFRTLASPRPHLGLAVHAQGLTSQAYAGLIWSVDLGTMFFAELGLGGTIHTGELDSDDPDREDFGTRILFRTSGGIGIKIAERITVTLTGDHISNAGLATPNNGMDRVGIMIGYGFGAP